VTHRTSSDFRKLLVQLPTPIQTIARKQFELLKSDPAHPSLNFKLIVDDIWSARVNLNYRALCIRHGEIAHWYWIGPHKEYDRILATLR